SRRRSPRRSSPRRRPPSRLSGSCHPFTEGPRFFEGGTGLSPVAPAASPPALFRPPGRGATGAGIVCKAIGTDRGFRLADGATMACGGTFAAEGTIVGGIEEGDHDFAGANREHPERAGSDPHVLPGSQLEEEHPVPLQAPTRPRRRINRPFRFVNCSYKEPLVVSSLPTHTCGARREGVPSEGGG